VSDRWQLAMMVAVVGQPTNSFIDGCFDGHKNLAHKKAQIIMGLGALYGGRGRSRTRPATLAATQRL
jgi:hypothetical protein